MEKEEQECMSDKLSSSSVVELQEHSVIDLRPTQEQYFEDLKTLEITPYESTASKLVASLISELRLEVLVVKQRQADMEVKLEQAIKLMAEAQEMIVSQEQFIAYLGRQLKREGRAEERDRQKTCTLPKGRSHCRIEVQEELTLEGTIDGHAVRIFGHLKTEMRVCLSCRKMIERAKAVRN